MLGEQERQTINEEAGAAGGAAGGAIIFIEEMMAHAGVSVAARGGGKLLTVTLRLRVGEETMTCWEWTNASFLFGRLRPHFCPRYKRVLVTQRPVTLHNHL